MSNTLPNPGVNPLALPMATPDLGGGSQRWINRMQSCNPWSGNSTLNGCITPQVMFCWQSIMLMPYHLGQEH